MFSVHPRTFDLVRGISAVRKLEKLAGQYPDDAEVQEKTAAVRARLNNEIFEFAKEANWATQAIRAAEKGGRAAASSGAPGFWGALKSGLGKGLGTGTGFIARQAGTRLEGHEQLWRQEWEAFVLDRCKRTVSTEFDKKKLSAFEMLASRGLPPDQVGQDLGMSRDAVYKAKSRVIGRMRQVREELELLA